MSEEVDDVKAVEDSPDKGDAKPQQPKASGKKKVNITSGLENEVLGTWSVRLRNFCGTLSVITTNIICLMGMWTIHKGVLNSDPWPHWIIVVLIVSGPVLVSFSYMNVSKVIQTILRSTDTALEVRNKFLDKLNR